MKISGPHDEFRKPLSRGEDGELHVAGSLMIRSYLGGVSPESFYKDDSGVQWFKTGDQARMNADGAIFILGRFKDVIIRGGENIAPAAIEVSLQKFEGVEVSSNHTIFPCLVSITERYLGSSHWHTRQCIGWGRGSMCCDQTTCRYSDSTHEYTSVCLTASIRPFTLSG